MQKGVRDGAVERRFKDELRLGHPRRVPCGAAVMRCYGMCGRTAKLKSMRASCRVQRMWCARHGLGHEPARAGWPLPTGRSGRASGRGREGRGRGRRREGMGGCAFLGPPPVGVPGRACGAHPPDQNSSGPVPQAVADRAEPPVPICISIPFVRRNGASECAGCGAPCTLRTYER